MEPCRSPWGVQVHLRPPGGWLALCGVGEAFPLREARGPADCVACLVLSVPVN